MIILRKKPKKLQKITAPLYKKKHRGGPVGSLDAFCGTSGAGDCGVGGAGM